MADDVLLSFSVQAATGKPKVIPVWLPNNTTLASCLSYAQAFVPLVEDVSDGYVAKASVTFSLDISGQSNGVASGNEFINYGARLLHDTSGRYAHGTWIPAFKPSLLSGTEVITDLKVTALEAALRAGLGGIAPTNGHAEDITAYKGGKRAYRK